jgi:hypothetical protein
MTLSATVYQVGWGYYPWDNERRFTTFGEALDLYRSLVNQDHPRRWVCHIVNPDRIDEGCEDGLVESEREQVEAIHEHILAFEAKRLTTAEAFELLTKAAQ